MQGKFMKVAWYARVSTHDQHTLPLQLNTMRRYVKKRRWTLTMQVYDVGSAAMPRPKREELLTAVYRRAIDVMVVWRLDRWGRSLADLVVTLKALHELGVGFVSLTEAIDLTTPSGRVAAGRILGQPPSAVKKAQGVKRLVAEGLSWSEIAQRVGIGRTSVRRMLT